MRRVVLTIILGLAIGCASMPPKDRAIHGLDFTDQRLSAFQDTERKVCNEAEYAKAVAAGQQLTMSIKTCAGPLAESAKLTTETHQKISALLADAFAIQKKATVLLRAWNEGQPAPPELADLLGKAQSILTIVGTLAGTDQQKQLIALSNTIIAEIQKVIETIRTGKLEVAHAA